MECIKGMEKFFLSPFLFLLKIEYRLQAGHQYCDIFDEKRVYCHELELIGSFEFFAEI